MPRREERGDRDRDRERERTSRPPRTRDRAEDRERRRSRTHNLNRASRVPPTSSESSSQGLSANSLAKLNSLNERASRDPELRPKKTRRTRPRELVNEKAYVRVEEKRRSHQKRRRRDVSGALLEEGDGRRLRGLRGLRGGDDYEEQNEGMSKKKKRVCE